MAEPVIDVHNLTKSYGGRKVVDALELRVERGQIYGFLGPNGSGKTTTIRMVCGLLKPDAGDGTCLGYDVLHDSERIKEHVGYMTQRFSLYEDLSIRENLEFIARMYGLDRRKQRVDEALEHLGLTSRAGQVAGKLSGGWKQRLALAACMIHDPDLLLLDEPTAGVDPKARRDFWDQIRAYAARGVTTLVSTHYMDEAVQCDRIAFIAYGKKLIDAPTPEIPRQGRAESLAPRRPRPFGRFREAQKRQTRGARCALRRCGSRLRSRRRCTARRRQRSDTRPRYNRNACPRRPRGDFHLPHGPISGQRRMSAFSKPSTPSWPGRGPGHPWRPRTATRVLS